MSEKNGRLRGKNWAQSFKLGGDEGLLGHNIVGCGKKAHGHKFQGRGRQQQAMEAAGNNKSLTWGNPKGSLEREKKRSRGGRLSGGENGAGFSCGR
jgi:hypothetical protein